MTDHIAVPIEFAAIARLFPTGVPRRHPLHGPAACGRSGDRVYLRHVDWLVASLFSGDPDHIEEQASRLKRPASFGTTLAVLETFHTLTGNGADAWLVPEASTARTPDIGTRTPLRASVEVTTAHPAHAYRDIDRLRNELLEQVSKKLPSAVAIEVDVRNVDGMARDFQGLAARVAKAPPSDGMSILIRRDGSVRHVRTSEPVDAVAENDPEVACVVGVGIGLSPITTRSVQGTSLKNVVRKKLANPQVLPNTERILVVDLASAMTQLEGAGYVPAIELVRRLASGRASLGAVILRCTRLPGRDGLVRSASVAWVRGDIRMLVESLFREDEELPDPW